ncbi:hypothetical protein BDV33DRAFT_211053 [Aspergillus novoparasiticus]|uniref:Uncharacterized protein n=1 Tax=Aspergillus novoparasiticus TaxID=986946 RepID=A0A5N6E7B2_9EURO|nr:hypothetical protein BDV33DRAFT_211053 [Aspergillus novoparasiticus]
MESHCIDPRALEGTADCEQPSASQVSPQASLEQTATDSPPFGSPGSIEEYEMPPSPATIYAAIRQRQTASAEHGQEGVDPHNQGPPRLNNTAYPGYDWYMPILQDKPPQPLYYPLAPNGLPPLKRCAAEKHCRSAPKTQESASDDHSACGSSSPFLGGHPEIFCAAEQVVTSLVLQTAQQLSKDPVYMDQVVIKASTALLASSTS